MDAIAEVETNDHDKPLEPIVMEKVTIEEKINRDEGDLWDI